MKRDEAPGWSLWSEKKKRSDTQWVSDLFVITRCFVLWINTYRPYGNFFKHKYYFAKKAAILQHCAWYLQHYLWFCVVKKNAESLQICLSLHKFTAKWCKIGVDVDCRISSSTILQNFSKRSFDRIIICMTIHIQCNACSRVSHHVLQTLHIKSRLLHIGTESVP